MESVYINRTTPRPRRSNASFNLNPPLQYIPKRQHLSHTGDSSLPNLLPPQSEEWVKLAHRMFFCIVAVLLLWLTTLTLAYQIVHSSIPSPVFSSVIQSCRYAYSETINQRNNYAQCASIQSSLCQKSLQRAYRNEVERSDNVLKQYDDLLHISQEHHSVCRNALTETVESLQGWIEASDSVHQGLVFTNTCTSENILKVQQLLGYSSPQSDYTSSKSIQSDAMRSTNIWAENSLNAVQSLAEYSKVLARYNQDYALNKTRNIRTSLSVLIENISASHLEALQDINSPESLSRQLHGYLDILLACLVVGENDTACPGPTSGTAIYTAIQEATLSNNMYFDTKFAEIRSHIQRYVDRVEEKIIAADNFFDTVTATTGLASWVNRNLVKYSPHPVNLCSIRVNGMSWCDFSKRDWQFVPFIMPALPTFYKAPSPDEIYDDLSYAISSAYESATAVANRVSSVASDWNSDILATVHSSDTFTANDYHPPPYESVNTSLKDSCNGSTVDDEVISYSQSVEVLVANISHYFSRISEAIKTELNSARVSAAALPDTASTIFDFDFPSTKSTFSRYSFSYQLFSPPDEAVLVEWLHPIQRIFSLMVLVDILYRIVQTIRLVRSHMKKTSLVIPAADLRPSTIVMCQSSIGSFSLMPSGLWMFIAAGLICIVIVTYALSAAYIPVYTTYQEACVNAHQTRNETFLSRNLNAAAYNYASNSGHAIVGNSLEEYNYDLTSLCSNANAEARSKLEEVKYAIEDVTSSHESVAKSTELLLSCVDMSAMDRAYGEACCGHKSAGYESCYTETDLKCPVSKTTGEAYAPPSSTINRSYPTAPLSMTCDSTIYPIVEQRLQSNIFDCDELPACDFTCSGPSRVMLQFTTRQCACNIEWEAHSTLLQSLAVGVVYVLINVSRFLFYKFLLMIHWQDITPNGAFEFSAFCSEDGTLQWSYDELKSLLNKKISKIICGLELKAYGYLLASIVVNVPWVYFLLYVSSNIEYKQH